MLQLMLPNVLSPPFAELCTFCIVFPYIVDKPSTSTRGNDRTDSNRDEHNTAQIETENLRAGETCLK